VLPIARQNISPKAKHVAKIRFFMGASLLHWNDWTDYGSPFLLRYTGVRHRHFRNATLQRANTFDGLLEARSAAGFP